MEASKCYVDTMSIGASSSMHWWLKRGNTSTNDIITYVCLDFTRQSFALARRAAVDILYKAWGNLLLCESAYAGLIVEHSMVHM